MVFTEHPIGKAAEPKWHVFGVDEGKAQAIAELVQIGHGRSAVDTQADAFVFQMPRVTCRAREADLGGQSFPGHGVLGTFF